MDQAEALGVLVALSKGGGVPYQETVKAGRLAANSLRDSGIETVMFSEKPWSGVWQLDQLTDEEAAAFALRFATRIEAVLAAS
jgi:hypothetical protein